MSLPAIVTASALCLGLAFGGVTASHAAPATVEAFENATIQPGGVRSGSSGLAFFNVEGVDNGNFASYGALRFDTAGIKASFDAEFGAGLWSIASVALQLTQSNAGFTTDGGVEVFYTDDDAISLIAGVSTLTYPVAGAFPDALNVASYAFTEVATGTLELHALADLGGLFSDILVGDFVTLLLEEADDTVAATYAGYTNFTLAGPTLVVSAAAVPLPAPFALLLVPLAGLLRRRRRAP